MTELCIIVAADELGGIGLDGRLPWHLPADLKRFKAITMGSPVVMGRKTWDSIGRPLPGRHNIIVSRQAGLAVPGCTVAGSLETALQVAGDVPRVFVIGGADLYRMALPRARTVHLTRVHSIAGADTFFPRLDAAEWEEVAREDYAADERHAHDYSFVTLRRRS